MSHSHQEALHADLPLGEPLRTAPGLSVERRCFLKTTALALGAVSLPGVAPLRLGETAAASLSLEEFIAEAVPVAEALVADTSLAGQDRYLLTLAALAVRLTDVPRPEFRDTVQGKGVSIGVNGAPGPFVILHWKMEPGAVIRAHAHTYGNVVTLGLHGVAQVENHEVVGARDYTSSEAFEVRRTVTQRLTPGSTNLVSLERNYIHGFRAGPEGARGLDITTRVAEKQPTPYLVLGAPVAGGDGLVEGHWKF